MCVVHISMLIQIESNLDQDRSKRRERFYGLESDICAFPHSRVFSVLVYFIGIFIFDACNDEVEKFFRVLPSHVDVCGGKGFVEQKLFQASKSEFLIEPNEPQCIPLNCRRGHEASVRLDDFA